MAKVVLAYSGGLDTSVCLKWLQEEKGLDVITFSAELGQGLNREELKDKALKSGAKKVHIEDLRETFLKDFVYPALGQFAEVVVPIDADDEEVAGPPLATDRGGTIALLELRIRRQRPERDHEPVNFLVVGYSALG